MMGANGAAPYEQGGERDHEGEAPDPQFEELRAKLRGFYDDLREPPRGSGAADFAGRLIRDLERFTQQARGDVAGDPFANWKTVAEIGDWFETAPPPRDWLLKRDDKGAVSRGIVALLVAPGGRGKTMALIQLAISIATGRPWLQTFDVASPGRVVLALAEEDVSELRRRLYYAAQGLELSEADRRLASENIVPLGLTGNLVSLVDVGDNGAVMPSLVHAQLVQRLQSAEHACVILDPLSRWAPEVESSNAAATGAVQCLEQLTQAPGSPTVVVAHHTAKWARRDGNRAEDLTASARGVTALTDGVRWVSGLLGVTEKDLAFDVDKSNYSPKGEPVSLVRDSNGILRPPTSFEIDMARAEQARLEGERVTVLWRATEEALADGPLSKASLQVAVRGLGVVPPAKQAWLKQVDAWLDEGRLVTVPGKRKDQPLLGLPGQGGES